MSHRKYEQPRHGSLGFLPRKRTKKHHGKIRKFPKDDASEKCHLTGFMCYKAGMTHVIRLLERPGSKFNKKEVLEAATILECPPMVPVGIVGYVITPRGLRALTTVWGSHLSANVLRRFYKNWYRSKQKAFSRYEKKYKENKEEVFTKELQRIKENCTVVRIIAHTQIEKLNLRQKKDHIMEIQVNGGTVAEKVDYAVGLLEKDLRVDSVFAVGEMIDTCAATKGRGFEGTTMRWGTKKLPRKTNKGIRRVACVGSWHPQNIRYSVARAGQNGYHHRTEINKKIIKICNEKNIADSATTEQDLSKKEITPMGGFHHYGRITQDFIMIKGCCPGVRKRPITLRKCLFPKTVRFGQEPANIKWIDTSSKWGHGRFQTQAEKIKFLGPMKKAIHVDAKPTAGTTTATVAVAGEKKQKQQKAKDEKKMDIDTKKPEEKKPEEKKPEEKKPEEKKPEEKKPEEKKEADKKQ